MKAINKNTITLDRKQGNQMARSIEPNVADLANGWLKSYKLNYKLEQESLNAEIDKVDLVN
jgi:hypothetical protein